MALLSYLWWILLLQARLCARLTIQYESQISRDHVGEGKVKRRARLLTWVFTIVVRPAVWLELILGRQVLGGHRGSLWVCIKQQQRLIMPLDAFGHHILPFGPNLNQKQPEHDNYIAYPQFKTYVPVLFFKRRKDKNWANRQQKRSWPKLNEFFLISLFSLNPLRKHKNPLRDRNDE